MEKSYTYEQLLEKIIRAKIELQHLRRGTVIVVGLN